MTVPHCPGSPHPLPNAAVYSLIGSRSIESFIQQRQLSFINSITSLDIDALPQRLLQEQLSIPSAKGLISAYRHLLEDLRLPSISQLLTQPPKLESWKSSTRKLLNLKTYLSLMEDCTNLHIGACSIPIGRPAHHWSVTLGDTNETRQTNFRIRLLTGCDGLEQDASHFSYWTHRNASRKSKNFDFGICTSYDVSGCSVKEYYPKLHVP